MNCGPAISSQCGGEGRELVQQLRVHIGEHMGLQGPGQNITGSGWPGGATAFKKPPRSKTARSYV